MSRREEQIRRRAYRLWEDAGRPEGRSGEFWLAAERDILGGADDAIPFDPLEPPIAEPPEVAFQHGAPVGMPGERIVEQGVDDVGLENLLDPLLRRKRDDG
ncbi:MAG: DUF2934 domain-containing protein [Hyphomicrobiales bacterium]|nr:DUF2934 domain-containing protein [Hyphomicrobiales bacterium]